MIKWLDTGIVDYEDLWAFSLENLCDKRGLTHSGFKRLELAQKLREDDASRYGGFVKT
jgi:hypothetical protein